MTDATPRSLTVTWEDPKLAASRAREMSGLDYLTAIMNGEISGAPIGSLLDIVFTAVERGRVVVRGRPGEHLYNPIGIVHGGYLSTMLDSAMGCAVHTELEAGIGYATTGLQVYFVRPVLDGIPELFAEGRVVYMGKKQATAEGFLRGPDDKLYAHGTTSCMILR